MPGRAQGWVGGHPLVRRLVSPAGLLLVALCFALPFVAVSCDSPGVSVTAEYTGVDMLVGGAPAVTLSGDQVPPDPGDADVSIGVQPAAVLAMAATVAGILVAFVPGRRTRLLGGAVAATAAAVFLVVGQILVQGYLARQVESGVGADPPDGDRGADFVAARYGFWLALVLACAVALFHCFELYRTARPRSPSEVTPAPQPSPGPLPD
jgi:hypothetical protein